MKFSHHKNDSLKEGKSIRCGIKLNGTNENAILNFVNNKAESKKVRKQKIRLAKMVQQRVVSEIREYREKMGITSTQFADKFLSFADMAQAHFWLESVSPTISELNSGYFAS